MKKCLILFLMLAGILLLYSCVTTGSSANNKHTQAASESSLSPEPASSSSQYTGYGECTGNTFLNARNKALIDAVRKAVLDTIGAEKEELNKSLLDNAIYNTKNPNAFIYKDTIKNVRKEMIGDDNWLYECTVDVNLKAIKNTLAANGLLDKEESASAGVIAETKPEEKPGMQEDNDKETQTPYYGEVTREEKAFIARYVDKMTYMVIFSDRIKEDIYYIKGAIGKANEYLASKAMDTIDFEQIEKLKEDQQMIYEEETGESISITQWIAQKLNADIYIEIYGKTDGTTKMGGKHYGQANIELKAFESSTAVLVGSCSYTTLDQAFSKTSQNAARLNAIQGAVYKTMPRLIQQVKKNMKKSLYRGIRYEITIQNPLGDRAMSRFWNKLKKKVTSIKSLSQSIEEVKYYVWHIGSIDDLKNIIYDLTETISGLENMEMVFSRGKTITFNTGT